MGSGWSVVTISHWLCSFCCYCSPLELLSLIAYILSFTPITCFPVNKALTTNWFSLPSNLKSVISFWPSLVQHSLSTASLFLFLWLPFPSYSFIPSQILCTTQILPSELWVLELSPELIPSFELSICLQICYKNASFSSPVAISSWVIFCALCPCVPADGGDMCVYASVCVCVCVWFDSKLIAPLPPPQSVYLALWARGAL